MFKRCSIAAVPALALWASVAQAHAQTYHSPNDDIAHMDIPFMTRAIQSLVEPLRWLASSDFRPTWAEGGRPERTPRQAQ